MSECGKKQSKQQRKKYNVAIVLAYLPWSDLLLKQCMNYLANQTLYQ